MAIVVFMPEDAFETPLGWRQLKRRFAMISRLGYDGVELLIENPRGVDVEKLKRLAESCNLEVPAIGTGPTYLRYGLSFVDLNQKIRRAAVKRVKNYLTLASKLNALVIIGLIRGKIGADASYKRAWRRVKHCLSKCALAAEDFGVMMALEPINRYETNIINTLDEASQMVDELRSGQVKVMADTFHMNIEEASIAEALLRAWERLIHVHVADSNRLAPGMGHLNFSEIISTLKAIKYNGYVSAEILLRPSFPIAAQKTIEYLMKMF